MKARPDHRHNKSDKCNNGTLFSLIPGLVEYCGVSGAHIIFAFGVRCESIMDAKSKRARPSDCLHFFEESHIVETFKDDPVIRRVTTKTLFDRARERGCYQCFKELSDHEKCRTFAAWKNKHKEEAVLLGETRPVRAVYVLLNREVNYKGCKMFIKGAIKSLDPPCTGKSSGNTKHPLTCNNCFKQQQYLCDLYKKRSQASYSADENRLGKKGFRINYASRNELENELEHLQNQNQNLRKTVTVFMKKERNSTSWEEFLHESCKQDYQEKLIVDLLHLFQHDIDQKKPLQTMILQNLVGKLRGTVNHRYIPIIKMIGKLHKIRLGETNYDLTKDIFGLPCSTTCDSYKMCEQLRPGFNHSVVDQAILLYLDEPVIEASDEARALRFLQPMPDENGEVILVGKCWSPDVSDWDKEDIVLRIPKRDEDKDAGPTLCSPHRSGTISTEKIIGQLQGKTNQLQSLNVSPTFGDMLFKSKDLQFTTEALTELEMFEGITIPSTSNRKLSHFRKNNAKHIPLNYHYPEEYEDFSTQQRNMHYEGVKAQEIVRKYLLKNLKIFS
ncbi:hypothetical protein OS493_033867 [Desmophyllum pertusum]|uniref:Uncharacterized protein n=1 Tax=Desmophyllum pertusum TaxID=174260 RepID=A0A9X0CI81_9CNID|nr:hypothetical protein OS493_033867 [Desmophyllum pertusum]